MSHLITARLLSSIPELQQHSKKELRITRLQGLTNHNFRIEVGEQDWVLRLPRPETNLLIDRTAEANNQALATALDIAPQPVWSNHDGTSLTPTLRHTRALKTADFADSDKLEMIVAPSRKLHRSGFQFQGLIEAEPVLEHYFSNLPESKQSKFVSRKRDAEKLLQRLPTGDLSPVASHIDLVLENLMLAEDQLWLIDWEFSAMASPYWDLASLCNAADLDAAQASALLHCYCADAPQMEESTLSDYRVLLQLINDCWMALVSP